MDSNSRTIVIIGPAHPYRGGLATFNQLLASRLEQEGHRVHLVTFRLQYPSFLFPGKSQYSDEAAPEGLRIHRWINSVGPWSWWRSGRRIAALKPDLVILRFWMPFFGPSLGTIARIVRRRSKARVVAITDNVVPHERRPLDRPLTRYFLASCNGFVCMSRAVLQDLKDFGYDRSAHFHPHPMYESFGPMLTKEEARRALDLKPAPYLLFFGFIRAYKGLDVLLEALSDPRLAERNVHLIVAGEFYEDPAPYERIIREHGLESRIVRHMHFIPDSEVRRYFCAADLVVQTYKHATQSGVTQVAYYYERPMLVTDVGGLAELVPHGKVGYVCPVDPPKVADAIVDFYQNDREQELVLGVQLERVKFSWESMMDCLFKAAQ